MPGLTENVEIRFATSPVAITHDATGAQVTRQDLATGTEHTERFDLVVGADGVHSTVRRLVFGPDAAFIRSLDHLVAATILKHPPVGFKPTDTVVLVEPGAQRGSLPSRIIPRRS